MRKQFRKKQKQDRLLNKDGISAGMNKGTLLLHLTSTFFPMLLFLALANSEHPDWNQFSSRETGLCPSSMLVRQQADSPQQRLDTVKLEAAGLGCQLCLGRVVGGRTKAPSVPTEVATLEVRPHGAHWAPPDRSLSPSLSLSLLLTHCSSPLFSKPSRFPDTFCFFTFSAENVWPWLNNITLEITYF